MTMGEAEWVVLIGWIPIILFGALIVWALDREDNKKNDDQKPEKHELE